MSGAQTQPAGGLSPSGRLMTVQECASFLRVSKMTVYRLVERGDIPSLRVGRSIRIPREEFAAWLRSTRPTE